jgi:hypothetical protein
VLLLHEIPLSIKDTCYPLPSHEGWIKFRGAGHLAWSNIGHTRPILPS